MSGIINSAGSKSGIIGTTELDYEEGTHTVEHKQTDGTSFAMDGSYQTLKYTKIGRLVHCTGWIIVGAITGTMAHTKFSLPFTCATIAGTSAGFTGTQNVLTYSVDYGGDGASVYVGNTQDHCQCISSRDNNTYAHIPAVLNDEYGMSITYFTDA